MTSKRGFTLIEVMAPLVLLAVALVSLLQLRNDAVARAATARSGSIASRLGLSFIHKVEAGRVADLFDGFQGDFAEDGFGDFSYMVGIGDGSAFAGDPGSDSEMTWRDSARATEEDDSEASIASGAQKVRYQPPSSMGFSFYVDQSTQTIRVFYKVEFCSLRT